MYHFLKKVVGAEGSAMKSAIKKNLLYLTAVMFCMGAVILLSMRQVRAEEAQTESTQQTSQEATTSTADTVEVFSFVAQKGDSYTKMARKAVQIFGIDNKVDLSGAQIVFVETNLTKLASSPELKLGETVSISKTTVSEWVEKAKQLTDAQKSLWQVYANRVDFNTNNVGEAQ